MSTHLNMSLDDSISKRKTENPRDRRGGSRPFKRGGFRGRGERRGGDRGDRGGFRRSGFKRFGGRDRFDRDRRDRGERGSGGNRERRDKFDGENGTKRTLSTLGIRSRFIKRTRAGGRFGESRPFRSERTERTERSERPERSERSERPISERRRLRVSNLDFNITHKDLMELFSKLGSLTKNKIEYDDLGRSKGTALIEYEKHDSAIKAMQEYDGAVLDGKTITVEFDDDAKIRKGESSLVRKTISKDYKFERGGRRRFDDDRRDRGDRFERFDRERGDRGDRGFRRGFRRDGFGGKTRWGKRD